MLAFASFLFGAALFPMSRYFPLMSALSFAVAAALLMRRSKYPSAIIIIMFGFFYAFLRFTPAAETLDVWNKDLTLTGRFVPESNMSSSGSGTQTFTIHTAFDDDSGTEIEELRGEDVTIFTDDENDTDEEYEILLKIGRERSRRNPGWQGNPKLYGSIKAVNEARDAPFSLRHMFDKQRKRLNEYILGRFKGDSAALVASVTTGETSYLSDDLKEAFNVTGLAHILSISGTHFGLFSVMMFGIFVFMVKRLPYRILLRLTIYVTPAQAAAMLTAPIMILYLGISGADPPAVRSFVVIALFLLGLLLGRKGHWLTSILFAAVLLVLWDPGVLFSISFQLSFMAVLFIGFAVEREDKGEEKKGGILLRYVKQSVLLTLAASIGTAPLVVSYFHYFSVISPLANLVASPLIGLVLVSLAVASSFTFLFSGNYLFAPFVSWVAGSSVAIVRLLAKIPSADIRIPAFPPVLCITFYLGFIPFLLSSRKKKWLFLPFAPFVVYAALSAFRGKELSVTFLDVGQGDSAVVRLPDKRTIVVDAGRTGKETAAFLAYEGVRSIDALAVSHVHPDHSGGIGCLMNKFPVKELWDNGRIVYPPEIKTGGRRRALERGDVIEAGDCRITVLHPYNEFYTRDGNEYEEENDLSLVLSVAGLRKTFLFAGDIGKESEQDVAQLEKWLNADVVKIPHHGSKTSSGPEFLSRVSPSVAVISVGRDNSFGHPSREVLERLSGARIFRTDIDGAVRITEAADGLKIRTYKDFELEKANDLTAEWRNIRRLCSRW